MLVQHMHWRNSHQTSTSTMARVASLVKLTVQKHVNKIRSPSRKKTGLVKTLKAKGQRRKEWRDSTQVLSRCQNKGLFPAKTIYNCQILLLELHYEMNRTRSRLKDPSCLFTVGLSLCSYNSGQKPVETRH